MEPETLKALKASIKKWERNARVRHPKNATLGTDNCPLCRMFLERNNTCRGCPVQERMRNGLCIGTPYEKASAAWSDWDFNLDMASKKAWQTAAQAEVDFLKSLLPEGETNV